MTDIPPEVRYSFLCEQTFEAAAFGDYRAVRENIGKTISFPDGSIRDIGAFIRNDTKDTLLHMAALGDHPSIAEFLLSKGADIKAANDTLDTALHMTAISGSLRTCRLLLESGADPNVQNAAGRTPLHFAVMNNNDDVALLLFEKGADPNLKNNYGMSGIVADLIHGRGIAARRILAANAEGHGIAIEINRQSLGGLTLLHLAAQRNMAGLAADLLAAGADPEIQSQDGRTALQICYENKFAETAEIIKQHQKEVALKRAEAGREKHAENLRRLEKIARPRRQNTRFP